VGLLRRGLRDVLLGGCGLSMLRGLRLLRRGLLSVLLRLGGVGGGLLLVLLGGRGLGLLLVLLRRRGLGRRLLLVLHGRLSLDLRLAIGLVAGVVGRVGLRLLHIAGLGLLLLTLSRLGLSALLVARLGLLLRTLGAFSLGLLLVASLGLGLSLLLLLTLGRLGLSALLVARLGLLLRTLGVFSLGLLLVAGLRLGLSLLLMLMLGRLGLSPLLLVPRLDLGLRLLLLALRGLRLGALLITLLRAGLGLGLGLGLSLGLDAGGGVRLDLLLARLLAAEIAVLGVEGRLATVANEAGPRGRRAFAARDLRRRGDHRGDAGRIGLPLRPLLLQGCKLLGLLLGLLVVDAPPVGVALLLSRPLLLRGEDLVAPRPPVGGVGRLALIVDRRVVQVAAAE
jgi:hypothetical protein